MSPPPAPVRRPGLVSPQPAHRQRVPLEPAAIGSRDDPDDESTQSERQMPHSPRAPVRALADAPPPIPAPRRGAARSSVPEPKEAPRSKAPSAAFSLRPYVPFRWSGLERHARREVDLLAGFKWVLPDDPAGAAAAVSARLGQLLEHECRISLSRVFVTQADELRALMPEPCFLAQLALAPHLPRGLLEVELALAHAAIDQLLGGAAGEAVVLRALTDIEEGVLSYLMLEAFKAFSPALQADGPRLRLEAGVRSVDEALALLSDETHLVVMQHVLTLGAVASGYFRLVLPASAVDELKPSPKSRRVRARVSRLFPARRARLQMLRDHLRIEIARCELSALDLRGLGPGDVVLVEEPLARPDLGEGGACKVRVGLGERGFWNATLQPTAEGMQVTLGELVLATELVDADAPDRLGRANEPTDPPDAPVFDEAGLPGGRTMETTLPANPWEHSERTNVSAKEEDGGAELLNDIPLHVAVELARVPVSADDVVSMRAGQILQLGRPASSAVELSVNGKRVAQGELVEVDGQLGVKITQLLA